MTVKPFDNQEFASVMLNSATENTIDEKVAAIRLVHRVSPEPDYILEVLGLSPIRE